MLPEVEKGLYEYKDVTYYTDGTLRNVKVKSGDEWASAVVYFPVIYWKNDKNDQVKLDVVQEQAYVREVLDFLGKFNPVVSTETAETTTKEEA